MTGPVVAVAPGARTLENTEALVEGFRRRTGGRLMSLMTSDDYPAYETAILHAYGAALDNPELIVACVVGDGEAETGPLAASWSSTRW